MVTDYLQKAGLETELDALGFQTVGYGCTTCIGNSGPLDAGIENVVKDQNLVVASVLSGNRNFEARVHQSVCANFLMSPPLVVAYALAGVVGIDLSTEPIGQDKDGADVITFTSSSTVECFLDLKLPLPENLKIASIGPITSATLRERGLYVDIEAEQHDIPGLVKAVETLFKE